MLFCFLFYYRLHNGDILSSPPTFNFDNTEEGKCISNAKNAVVKATEKLAKAEGLSLVTQYKPVLLEDLVEMLSNSKYSVVSDLKTNSSVDQTNAKYNMIEGLLRLYDLVHYVETELKDPKNLFYENTVKTKKNVQAQVREIMKLKHKLIFYLCYLKDQQDDFYAELAKEVKVLQTLEDV